MNALHYQLIDLLALVGFIAVVVGLVWGLLASVTE